MFINRKAASWVKRVAPLHHLMKDLELSAITTPLVPINTTLNGLTINKIVETGNKCNGSRDSFPVAVKLTSEMCEKLQDRCAVLRFKNDQDSPEPMVEQTRTPHNQN